MGIRPPCHLKGLRESRVMSLNPEVGIGELVLPLVEECILRGLDVDVLVAIFDLPGQFVSFLVGLLVFGLDESGDGFSFKPPFLECVLPFGAVRRTFLVRILIMWGIFWSLAGIRLVGIGLSFHLEGVFTLSIGLGP